MKATAKSVRVSTRKVRLVADAVRNMSAKQALSTLSLVQKRGSSVLMKTIKSAVANAVNTKKLTEENLIIDKLEVNEGPFLKRFHASTRGRVHPFKKRSTHVTVVLKEANGKKVNPIALRLGPVYNWQSRWFNNRNYKDVVLEDYALRTALMDKLKNAGIARVEIERSINSIKVIIFVSRPGMVIGRAGTGLEDVKKFILGVFVKNDPKKTGKNIPKIDIRVEGVKEPNLDAYLVAKNVSDQLIKRLPFKRILAQNAERVMAAGAKGVKIALAGRIAGAEIGRREKIHIGTVPLSTIREYIQYASVPSLTKKGYIGVKVWINVGEKQLE